MRQDVGGEENRNKDNFSWQLEEIVWLVVNWERERERERVNSGDKTNEWSTDKKSTESKRQEKEKRLFWLKIYIYNK